MTVLNTNIYRGQFRQRGAGVGGLFARLFRSSIPYLKTLGQYAKNQLFDAGAGVLSDMQKGITARDALKRNAKSTRDRIVSDITRKMTGGGVKRRKKNMRKNTKKAKFSKKRESNIKKKKKSTRRKRMVRRKSKKSNMHKSFDLF